MRDGELNSARQVLFFFALELGGGHVFVNDTPWRSHHAGERHTNCCERCLQPVEMKRTQTPLTTLRFWISQQHPREILDWWCFIAWIFICCRKDHFKGLIITFGGGGATTRILFNHVFIRESTVSPPRIKHVWSVSVSYLISWEYMIIFLGLLFWNIKLVTQRKKENLMRHFYLHFLVRDFLNLKKKYNTDNMALCCVFVIYEGSDYTSPCSSSSLLLSTESPHVHLLLLEWFNLLSGWWCVFCDGTESLAKHCYCIISGCQMH